MDEREWRISIAGITQALIASGEKSTIAELIDHAVLISRAIQLEAKVQSNEEFISF